MDRPLRSSRNSSPSLAKIFDYAAPALQEYRNARDVNYTHIHQDIRESLDHILVSQEYYDNSRKRSRMFDGMLVNNDHLNFDDHTGLGTNDHGLIRATFKYKPASFT